MYRNIYIVRNIKLIIDKNYIGHSYEKEKQEYLDLASKW